MAHDAPCTERRQTGRVAVFKDPVSVRQGVVRYRSRLPHSRESARRISGVHPEHDRVQEPRESEPCHHARNGKTFSVVTPRCSW